MSGDYMPVGELHLERCIRQGLYDRAFKFDYVVFRQNNPSYTCLYPFNISFSDLFVSFPSSMRVRTLSLTSPVNFK